MVDARLRSALRLGGVIPAHPLALDHQGRLDERRQRALTRYYLDAGVAGVAIGVHTTQFAIRQHGLYRPVLQLGRETVRELSTRRSVITIAGVIGPTRQAVREAELARTLGYDLAMVSLGGLHRWDETRLLLHLREIGRILPLMGFFLQPAVGGRPLSYRFWRRLAEREELAAIKVAPFSRYQTLDVIRAVVDAGRHQAVPLYTGNDDNIVADLTTPFRLRAPSGRMVTVRFVGGLLGHWAYWTRRAVELVEACAGAVVRGPVPTSLSGLTAATTDANSAIFDAANGYRGCIAGIGEVLRRQRLVGSRRSLDPTETLSPGQAAEITRVSRAYPFLTDDDFVAPRLDGWMS